MALKDTWVDKKNTTDGNDGDYIVAEDINAIANAVIDLEEHNDNKEFYTKDETDALLGGKADKSNVYTQTETNARISQASFEVKNYTSNIIQTMATMVQDELDKKASADNVYTKSEIDNKIGSIDTALDELDGSYVLQGGKNILIPDSESGYWDGTTPKASTNHIRTPNPIPIESGHTYLTVTTDLDESRVSTTHYFCVIFLDNEGTAIRTTSKSTRGIFDYPTGEVGFDIPTNATAILLWLSGVNVSGATFANFSVQYDNYNMATFEPYVEARTVLKKEHLAYGVQPLYGKTIVNFGDSIFGNYRPPNDISSEIARLTGATVHNCGFGGCRMAKHSSTQFDTFSMYRLADAIANNDWTLQDTAVNTADWGMPSYYPDTLALLKTVDFSKVDIITIAYGTNDFMTAAEIENAENSKDTTKFAGALRYSIETLLGAYPHLKIFVCSQTYRFWLDDNGEFSADSDTYEYQSKKLTDYVAKTKEVAEEYHLPYIDNYNIGMNKYNRSMYFSATDGTHPNLKGRNLIASHIANVLY